jgi:hypothetical protein
MWCVISKSMPQCIQTNFVPRMQIRRAVQAKIALGVNVAEGSACWMRFLNARGNVLLFYAALHPDKAFAACVAKSHSVYTSSPPDYKCVWSFVSSIKVELFPYSLLPEYSHCLVFARTNAFPRFASRLNYFEAPHYFAVRQRVEITKTRHKSGAQCVAISWLLRIEIGCYSSITQHRSDPVMNTISQYSVAVRHHIERFRYVV